MSDVPVLEEWTWYVLRGTFDKRCAIVLCFGTTIALMTQSAHYKEDAIRLWVLDVDTDTAGRLSASAETPESALEKIRSWRSDLPDFVIERLPAWSDDLTRAMLGQEDER